MKAPSDKQLGNRFSGNLSIECANIPILSSRNQNWDNIFVEQFTHPAGEGKLLYPDEHVICLSLAPHPVRLHQIQDGKTYTGLYGKGDFSITPAAAPIFARWDSDDSFMQIRVADRHIRQVAIETLAGNPDRLELIPEFRNRDAQIEAIAMMLLAELKPDHGVSKLYIDSLANVLAVHLLRQYTVSQPHLPVYSGGLPQRPLLQVLDYIQAHLDQNIKLADLAQLLGISQFHFSALFKQSMGISPHQYLLQQRIERAKQLLQQTNKSIMDIALACGFSSHSHLSNQFRQVTGVTPKTYRTR